jgi:uncharacterized lipoprotein YbaY
MPGIPVLIEGDIEFEDLASQVAGATIYVRLEDVSLADAPSIRLAEQVIRDVTLRGPGRVTVPFSVQGSINDPNGQYVISVHVDLNGNGLVEPGDYITTESYPIPTPGETTRMLVTVRRVR